ncbi:MAG TPA: DUF2934 domain-containing protein [Acidisoma sp.]|jgi:hypothetical protein|nr:DUF2934 domain-containing protein [Acidisoma sp.]
MSGNEDQDRLQRVREIAYEMWEKEGSPEGREQEFWLRAEQMVDGGTHDPAHPTHQTDADVDRDLADSFPASDPPSFNP